MAGASYLGVEHKLLLIVVKQRDRVGLGVVDKDLQTRVERRAFAVRATREHTLEALLERVHGNHRAVGRLVSHAVQGGAQPAEAQDEERQYAARDEKQSESDALVLSLGVLVRDPDLSHRSSRVSVH